MRILAADDEGVSRLRLTAALAQLGYEVIAVADGEAAWQTLRRPDGPKLAILDWEMPGLSGPEVCRRVRAEPTDLPPYLFLLTVRQGTANLVDGLRSGANDYLTKPFHGEELAARLSVAARVLELQQRLAERVHDLEQALAQVRQLQGMLPMCGWCRRKIRTEQDHWEDTEQYLARQAGGRITHGICPECLLQQTRQM